MSEKRIFEGSVTRVGPESYPFLPEYMLIKDDYNDVTPQDMFEGFEGKHRHIRITIEEIDPTIQQSIPIATMRDD
jgi:hypothetical protein